MEGTLRAFAAIGAGGGAVDSGSGGVGEGGPSYFPG